MIHKIAFLFLTIADIYHEAMWKDFFQSHESQYTIYVHPKEQVTSRFFKRYVIPHQAPTSWTNTMRAQVKLLKEALKNPENDKFVYISESTIPLLTFEEVFESLDNPYSQFHYAINTQNRRHFGKIDMLYKNSQWIVLNRKHAELIVAEKKLLKTMCMYPHDQEHYPSTLLAQEGMLSEVIKKDTTLAIWDDTRGHPHTFTDLSTDKYTKHLVKAKEEKRFLFARKFAKENMLFSPVL